MLPKPRKRKVTYNEPGDAHFLTFSCHQQLPLLSKDRSRHWVIESLRDAREKCDFALWAYVIMPEHVHLLVKPRAKKYDMGRFLATFKRPVAVKAKAFLVETGKTDWLERLTVREGDQTVFRFWLPGGGHDENLWSDRPLLAKIEYIHQNPVRRGLVEKATDWPWSSARFWAGIRPVLLEMDPLEL